MLKTKGFTLIELMIAVAILGILAGIAYPSYQDSVRESRRADAKGALLGFANSMERYYTENNTYVGAPVNASTAYYTLTINKADVRSYELHATPQGSQVDDKCGTLSLTQTGVRGPSTSNCW